MKFLNIDGRKTFFVIISGIMLTMAFPKPGHYWLAFFAFIPFLFSIKHCNEKQSVIYGLIFGLSHFFSLLSWVIYTVNTYGFLPIWLCIPILFLLALYLSLYTAVFSWFLVKFCKNPIVLIIVAPALWVCLEMIRSYALTGFPWELLGYSQYRILPIIQIADITGVYGISFLIILVNISLFQVILLLTKKEWQGKIVKKLTTIISLSVTVLLMVMSISYGYYKIRTIDKRSSIAKKAVISAIQGNIDQSLKWKRDNQVKTINKYNNLSFMASGSNPDLIIWPETAAPFYYGYNKKLTNRVVTGITKTKSAHVIGSPSFDKVDNNFVYYNTAYVINPAGTTLDKYHKVHLVPFGEYVPLKKFLPFINKLTEQVGDFLSGKKGKTIKYKDLTLGIQICFEVVFPNLSRAAVNNGANLLINMTNDAWFGKKSAPFQHFSMVVFRAVENRRAVARAANTGISGFVDPVGRILSPTGLYVDALVTERLPLLKTITFYTKNGDIFAWFCFFLVGFGVIADKRRKN